MSYGSGRYGDPCSAGGSDSIQVTVVDVAGGGGRNQHTFPAGTTIQRALDRLKPGHQPGQYKVSKNGMIATPGETLNNMDQLSISPTKLAGA